jgi:hypothetical protein
MGRKLILIGTIGTLEESEQLRELPSLFTLRNPKIFAFILTLVFNVMLVTGLTIRIKYFASIGSKSILGLWVSKVFII